MDCCQKGEPKSTLNIITLSNIIYKIHVFSMLPIEIFKDNYLVQNFSRQINKELSSISSFNINLLSIANSSWAIAYTLKPLFAKLLSLLRGQYGNMHACLR